MDWKKLLSNKWMSDPLFHVQSAHALNGAFIIMVCAFFWSMTGVYCALGIGLPILALKEFYYDLKYELPNDTIKGSLLDFGCYMIGASVSIILALVKFYALRH